VAAVECGRGDGSGRVMAENYVRVRVGNSFEAHDIGHILRLFDNMSTSKFKR